MVKKRNPQKSNPQGIGIGDLVLFKEGYSNKRKIGVVIELDFAPANVYEQEQTDAVIYWSGGDDGIETHKKGRVDALYLEKISL